LLSLLVIALFGAAAALEKQNAKEPTPEVIATLETTTPTVKKGEQPMLNLTLVNRSSGEIVLVKPGDGSDGGWRTPIVTCLVDGEVDGRLHRRCGNINRLKPDEVVTLKPGERLKMSEWLGTPSLPRSGTYKLSLRYVHDPKLEWKGIPLGMHDKGAMEKIKASRHIEVESNVVEITVKE
jgi:hypothetical protein